MLGFEIIIDHLFKRIMAMAKTKPVPVRFNDGTPRRLLTMEEAVSYGLENF